MKTKTKVLSGWTGGIAWREKPEDCLEQDLEDYCTKLATSNYVCLHRKLDGLGHKDWPDRQYWFKNKITLLVEFKRFGEKLTPGQARCHRVLRKMGHDVRVIDRVAKFAAMLAEVVGSTGYSRKQSRK